MTNRSQCPSLVTIALLAPLLFSCTPVPAPPVAQNLVLVSLDTTRRDHLGTYGYERDTSPKIDALAQTSAVFLNAFAQFTTTKPSHTSMFTGLYPHTHGVGTSTRLLAQERLTLAEILRDEGFDTGAFLSGFPFRVGRKGLDQGFDIFDVEFEDARRDGRETTGRALSWLQGRDPDERFFLFLHLYDAHGPYRPDEEYEGLFRSETLGPELHDIPEYQKLTDEDGAPLTHLNAYVDRYDAMIRYQDDLVGDLLSAVDLDQTVVLVTSDHGESLGERTQVLDHGRNVFDEQIRIPLILHTPGGKPARHRQIAETVDFLPTLLDILRVPRPEMEIQGKSLVAVLEGESQTSDGVTFSSCRVGTEDHSDKSYVLDDRKPLHSIRGDRWKLIVYPGLDREFVELYDLEQDSLETAPLEPPDAPGDRQQAFAELQGRFRSWLGPSHNSAETEVLSPEDIEKLQALGYLGD